jgi:hypothetical protein
MPRSGRLMRSPPRRSHPFGSCANGTIRIAWKTVPKGVAVTVWIIIGVCVVVGMTVVWWRDRRHHGRVDQRRVTDGVTKYQIDSDSLSRRDHYRD